MANELNFYLITDLHHYAKSLGTNGKGFERALAGDQKCLKQTGAIIDAYIDRISEDSETDIVLVDGDVSCNGAKESHLDLIPRLRRLKDNGKRVFVITATHDYYVEGNEVGEGYKCVGDEILPATQTTRDELVDLYFEFGMNEALSIHKESHCYSVKLKDGYRLLCLNDDGDRIFCGFYEDTLRWIDEEIDKAREAGDYIFAITHHPVLPPSPIYPIISERDMLGDWERTAKHLADKGIKFIFTGHAHMMNIARLVTEKGNELYDINTSSLVGYPSVMRKVVFDEKEVHVSSIQLKDFDDDFDGMDPTDYMKMRFDAFLNRVFDTVAFDYDTFANEVAPSFSVTPERAYKLKFPLNFLGKKLHSLTFKKAGRLLCVSRAVAPEIADRNVKDFAIEVVRNVFYGDEPYTPDTAEYKACKAAFERIFKIAKPVKKLREPLELANSLLDGVLYNAPPADWEGTFLK